MKRVLLFLCLAVVGCSQNGCDTMPKVPGVVPVAVATPVPKPPERNPPALPIAEIGPSTPEDEVMRLYVATVKILQGYARELEQIIDGYRTKDLVEAPK